MRVRTATLAALLALTPLPLAAQWEVELEPPHDGRPGGKVAVGRNSAGDTLQVRRTADGTIEAVLVLRPGLSPLADGCPSYRVDTEKPRALVTDGEMCRTAGRSVTFLLGRVRDERVDSASLLEMMNGSRMRFVYHVRSAGYEEAAFSLAGSKQAITDVIGGNIVVNGRQ